MANSDYKKNGNGAFASSVALDTPLGPFDTSMTFTRARLSRPITVGMAAMAGDEIMRVDAVDGTTLTLRRGCADTVPAAHQADNVLWLFDASTTGSDRKERSAGEIASVKVSPFTIGGGGLDPANAPPLEVVFAWRFFRPYAPGQFRVNGERFTAQPTVDDNAPVLNLTWVHRDRVLQADQLVGHDDASIGPEPGTTYTLRVFNPLDGSVVRVETGISAVQFMYRRAQALFDLGQPQEVVAPYFTFHATRDGFDSFQGYLGRFTLAPAGAPADVQVMPFEQRVIEAPYAINVRQGVQNNQANYGMAFASRPVDRMADSYELLADTVPANAGNPHTFAPWVLSDYRLPALETIVNVRTSSLTDGVPLSISLVGQLAMIDDEIVQVVDVQGAQITIKRGCLDTVPTVHIAGARLWFFEASYAFDRAPRATDDAQVYRLRPGSYTGTPYDYHAFVANYLKFGRRSILPYAPGRLVVSGRPWFEEAQAVAGSGITITWARRNRLSQAGAVVGHADPDVIPEDGQSTRLTFYFETPAASAGDPPDVHVMRQVDVAATGYLYSYTMAQQDGDVAGRALGICGTVVIYCRIAAVRDSLTSLQSYVVPIRVPSYPC